MDYQEKLERLSLLIDLYKELSSDIQHKNFSRYGDETQPEMYPIRSESLSVFSDFDSINREVEIQNFQGPDLFPE